MKWILYFFAVILLTGSCTKSQDRSAESWTIADGYVPDRETAIKIGQIIGERIYGKETIDSEKPLSASLTNGKVWVVEGTHVEAFGGVLHLEIQKSDGKILKVIHGR